MAYVSGCFGFFSLFTCVGDCSKANTHIFVWVGPGQIKKSLHFRKDVDYILDKKIMNF